MIVTFPIHLNNEAITHGGGCSKIWNLSHRSSWKKTRVEYTTNIGSCLSLMYLDFSLFKVASRKFGWQLCFGKGLAPWFERYLNKFYSCYWVRLVWELTLSQVCLFKIAIVWWYQNDIIFLKVTKLSCNLEYSLVSDYQTFTNKASIKFTVLFLFSLSHSEVKLEFFTL